MTPRRRLMTPYLLLALGLGLCGYYGLAWLQLPQYSQADIEASAELNLRLDQQRDARAQDQAARREKVIGELREDIARERREVETGLGAGLIALVAALGNFVLAALLRRATPT